MHDTDANPPIPQPGAHPEQAIPLPHTLAKAAREASPANHATKAPGLFARIWHLLTGIFHRKPRIRMEYVPAPADAERAAAARDAQLAPPMAFKGDTANSALAITAGTYAGKPAQQAIHRRGEQQFKNMDITRTTMH